VRSIGKLLKWGYFPALLLLGAGCGGIRASKSFSPLDFILPGLLQADPPPAAPTDPAAPNGPVTQVAQN
jgi:hypothetical protein